MKIRNTLLLLCLLFFMSCYDDKGNYKYSEMAEISIENLPETFTFLPGIEPIVAQPKVTSSLEGELTEGNPNFEFSYRLEKKGGGSLYNKAWIDLNPSKSLNLDTIISIPQGNYIAWFSVKDKRTAVEYSATFDVKATSTIYEGWMVLCNEGPEERMRMDMISVISADRIVPIYDVLASSGLPELQKATKIGFYPKQDAPNDVIYVMSEKGAYKLDRQTFETSEMYNIYTTEFLVPPSDPDEYLIEYMPLSYNTNAPTARVIFAISNKGNLYASVSNWSQAFESPINTSVCGGAPEYRVAPYVGISMVRCPANSTAGLFYDIDNKRFVGWDFNDKDIEANQILYPIPNPEAGQLFDFNTGMDLVYMEGTLYSDGLVYAVLQDATGKRVVYGINMGGKGFVQESKYEDLNAPDLDKATAFAFHSQFPYMFYAVGNKVYLHNLGTNTTYEMNNIQLGANEEVTLLKFNLYHNNNWVGKTPSQEFMNRQFELMVGSYDNSVDGVNGGKVGFYPVDANNSVTKRAEYTGFARITDIRYREQR